MNKRYILKIEDSKNSMNNFNVDIKNYNVIFFTEKYNSETVNLTFENPLYKFLESKNNENIKIFNYEKEIDKITFKNSLLIDISTFFIEYCVMPIISAVIYDFLKTKLKKDDLVGIKFHVEMKNKNNKLVSYEGPADDLIKIIEKTENFEKLINDETNNEK